VNLLKDIGADGSVWWPHQLRQPTGHGTDQLTGSPYVASHLRVLLLRHPDVFPGMYFDAAA
jgi:hypothetical protein